MISSGRRWFSCYRKNLIIFYYFWTIYMLAFHVAYPSIHIFQSCISNPFYRHPIFCRVTLSPFLLEAQPLPLTTIIFPELHAKFCLESSPNVLEPHQPYPPPPTIAYRPPKLHSVMKVYFLNSLSLFSKYSTYIYFLTINIFPSFFWSGKRKPIHPLNPTQYFGLD